MGKLREINVRSQTLRDQIPLCIAGQVKMIAAFPSILWYTVGMTTLPVELQEMVEHSGDTPVRVVDPRTQRVYVLIADEQFDRLRSLLDMEPLTIDQQRIAIGDAGKRAGWDDPEMDVYDQYDVHRPQT